MPTLINCIRKAIEAGLPMHEEDRAAMLARAKELRKEGMTSIEAGRQAIKERSEHVSGLHQEIEAKWKDAGSKEETTNLTPDQIKAQKIAESNPEMMVSLPGSEETITVSDAIKQIAEEQTKETQWADLVKVAVECALEG